MTIENTASEEEAAQHGLATMSLLTTVGLVFYTLLCFSRRHEINWPPVAFNCVFEFFIFGGTYLASRRGQFPTRALSPWMCILGLLILHTISLSYRCGLRENIMARLIATMIGGGLFAQRGPWIAIHLVASLLCAQSLLGPLELPVVLTLFLGTVTSLSAYHLRRQELQTILELYQSQDQQNLALERTLDDARRLSSSLDQLVAQRTANLEGIHVELAHTLETQLSLFEERARLEGQMQEGLRLESLGRAAGVAAHDFNNMLAILSCSVELLLEMRPADGDLEDIRQATGRISKVGKEMLTLSGRQFLHQENVDVATLAQEWGPMLTGLLGDTYEFSQQMDAPETILECDKQQLFLVLAKLLANAAEAMPDGGRISLVGRPVDQGRYQLELSDEGPGIPEDQRDKVFEPFYTNKDRNFHSGLGLPTARAILRQHGGAIGAAQTHSGGGLIRLTLPIRNPLVGLS